MLHGMAMRTPTKSSRRSPCPIACSLDVFGDRWTLLLVRDMFFGRTRFKDFTGSPEGIPTNILSERLSRLVAAGLVRQVPAEDGSRRMAYRLTRKGLELAPVLRAIKDWGLRWEKGTKALMEEEANRGLR